jgi:hypothetical protein
MFEKVKKKLRKVLLENTVAPSDGLEQIVS